VYFFGARCAAEKIHGHFKGVFMKSWMFLILLFCLSDFSAQAATCDNETVDALVEKQLAVIAARYDSKKVGLGVSIQNGNMVTTNIAVFQGKGGNDGTKVDRIGQITVNLDKCQIQNSLVGLFDVIELP
jgi:hypothetical protein